MSRSRIIRNILILILAFLLFTIWYQKCIINDVPTSTLPLVKYYDVYLISTDEKYQFWQYVNNGAADMAEIVGINYFWRAPVVREPEEQIKIINKVVEDGADGLLVVADDPRLISGAIEDAKARGVKVVYIDAPANEEVITTLSTDNYEAGFAAGYSMISNLKKSGIKEGSIGIIDVRSKVTTQQRDAGFRDALNTEPSYKVLETIDTNGDPRNAELAAEQMINQNDNLVGLFATNEGTSEGIGNAIKKNKNNIVGIGFDKSDTTMELFNEGSLKAIISQHPYTMGYLGVAEIVAALLGKDTGPSFIDTDFTVIEKD